MAVELLSVTPSPSREQDVFGKELRLSESEKKLLSAAGEIFLSKVVHVETHSKKGGDSAEPRTLVISSSRCYILVQNPSTKLETSFNFLKIQELKCSEKKLTFHLSGEAKPRELVSSRQDSVEVISLITAQLRNVFPKTPLDLLLKLTYDPDSLRNDVSNLRDELTNMMERVDASTVQGFLTAYAFLCDYFSVEYNKEVSWYLKNVYLAHGLRELKLSDFDHLSPKDFLPVVSSLRHNHFFEAIVDRDSKLGPQVVEEFSQVLNSSPSIKALVLSNCGLKPDNIVQFSNALKNNPRASLTHLNLSDNALDDRAVEALGSALEVLPHGLQQLKLANCKMSVKSASSLANNMKQNKHMQFSLVHLDLSSNPLGPDSLGALSFLQDPQTISSLNLSNCNLLLEHVVPVLNRGCTQHLCRVDLSNNTGKGKKVVHPNSVAAGLQQFCSSSITVQDINFSNCKLSSGLVKSMLEGLAVNPNVTSVKLDISSNDLSGAGAEQMLTVVGRVSCLQHLNISECGLEQNMSHIISAVTHNRNIAHLVLGRNFSGKAAARMSAVQQLAAMLANDDCQLVSLSLEDSHLKEHTTLILEALVDNNCLAKINLSGNQMGGRGARSLARTLLSNCSLTEIRWDHNDTSLRGFQEVAAAMQQNYTLRVMPLPLGDIGRAGKGVEEHVQTMQKCLCRNHSDERLKVEIAARHRSRLLTASQQSSAVGRELVQLEDLLQWIHRHDPSHELVVEATKVKELANRAIKLTDGLYSPQVESEQFQAITCQVKDLLDQFMESLFEEHIQARSEKMVKKSISICDTLLSEETCQGLQELVVIGKGEEFTQAKKDVLRHALPEIVNHVSDSNVEVAANISELVVDHTLRSLEKMNHKMFKLQKEIQAKNQQAPDAKVSRNFTFRVQEDNSPTKKKKKRVRRPDPEDEFEDLIDLPTVPLETEGPVLQHLGKTRPKPARVHRGRPSIKPTTQPEALDSTPTATDHTPTATDHTPTQPKVALKPPAPQVADKPPSPQVTDKPPSPQVTDKPPSPQVTDKPPSPQVTDKPPSPQVTDKPPSPQMAEVSPPEAAEKPPPPQVAEKAIKQVLETKSKGVVDKVEGEKKEEEDKPDKDAETTTEGEEEVKEEVSSDERCTSEEPEEHRVVVQVSPSQDDQLRAEKDKSASPELAKEEKEEQSSPQQEGDSSPANKNNDEQQSKEGQQNRESGGMLDWEVIDAKPAASPSPEVIKKPPPAVKEKPRKVANASGEDEEKKVPILPPGSALQKGALKPTNSEGGSGARPQPSPPPAAKTPTSDQGSPQPTRSTPSPAPKTRPKPASRKKAEAKAHSADSKDEDPIDTLV